MNRPFPDLESKAILSPMAGVTDVAFRSLCRRYGAGLTVTEFTSAAAVVRESEKARQMLQTAPEEQPVAVQLFGHDEDEVVRAAQQVQDRFDIIDINCGCPAWKVIRSGAGSAMLERPDRIARFVERLVRSTERQVTVKIRAGIDDGNINALQVARMVERAGASALAIHGRTQKQGYSGNADWELIKDVKRAVRIPVIGNGDVFRPEQFLQRLEESGVDYILVARGAIGNPYVFTQINDFLSTGQYRVLKGSEKMALFLEYLSLARKYDVPFAQVKTQAQSFSKGLTASAGFREGLVHLQDADALRNTVEAYIDELKRNE